MHPSESSLASLQRHFETLAPASRIASSLRALVVEGNVNPDDILPLVKLEPLLAIRILREANLSPSRKRDLLSIEDAVTEIGFQRLYDLISLYSYPPEAQSEQAYFPSDTWKRAITTAVCMQNLAHKHGPDPQHAYAIGLVHSIALAVAQSQSAKPLEDPYAYAELSRELLADWCLPYEITEPIAYQFRPLECQTTGKNACLLNLSKWITGVVREVDELPTQALGPDILVLNLLGEGEQTLWNIVTDVSDGLFQADAYMQGQQ